MNRQGYLIIKVRSSCLEPAFTFFFHDLNRRNIEQHRKILNLTKCQADHDSFKRGFFGCKRGLISYCSTHDSNEHGLNSNYI